MTSDKLFDRYLPALLLAMILTGAYYQQVALVTVGATLLFTLLLTRFWSSHSLDSLAYRREPSDERAFPGEELLLSMRLSNGKLLPLPWVEVDDRVPASLLLLSEAGDPIETVEGGRLRLAGSVSWNESIVWRYRMRCRRRGIYRLGPALVTSGDPFGFFPRWAKLGETQRLVVYPRLIPVDEAHLPSGYPLGDTRAPRWLFEEPTRVVGVREYRPEDPLRRIHWKATARLGELQVRIHEPTVELSTALFLGVDTFTVPSQPAAEEPVNDPFEYGVSLAASLAHLLIGRGIPVGLYVNWGVPGGPSLQLPPASSQEQLMRLLESLAAVTTTPCCSLEALLSEVTPRLPWGSTVVAIVGKLSDELLSAVQSLGNTGCQPVVLPVELSSASLEETEGVLVHPVSGPATLPADNGRAH